MLVSAERPGTSRLFDVSSQRLTALSQPQYAKTPIRSAAINASRSSMANGENHDHEGSIASGPASPLQTFPSATPANRSSDATWAMIITFWIRAESSVPRMQIHVSTRMYAIASTVTAAFEPAAPSAPNSR